MYVRMCVCTGCFCGSDIIGQIDGGADLSSIFEKELEVSFDGCSWPTTAKTKTQTMMNIYERTRSGVDLARGVSALIDAAASPTGTVQSLEDDPIRDDQHVERQLSRTPPLLLGKNKLRSQFRPKSHTLRLVVGR